MAYKFQKKGQGIFYFIIKACQHSYVHFNHISKTVEVVMKSYKVLLKWVKKSLKFSIYCTFKQ